MTKVTGRTIDPAFEIHLALYQPSPARKKIKKPLNRWPRISLT